MDEATETDSDAPLRRRKSNRPRKRTTAYSPEPKSHEVKKKKTFGKTQPNRPYDILPNGEPFSCALCKCAYVGNIKGSKKTVKSRHTPLPKVRVDKHTGRELQLCNPCAQSYDRPQNRRKKPEIVPTEQEQEAYLNEAKLFTKALRADLDVPQVDKLFCPVNKRKICGCLQRYIKNEMAVNGISCVQELVKMMTEAEELRKEKVYSQIDKTKPKKSVGLGNGHKKSKRYEEFVITRRRDLKEDMRLCERATQRILMYSNNFLHKKLKTEERPCRLERTRGKAALGKLPEIHQLVDMVCCTETCVMMALTHKRLLQKWRDRSKLGQTERRRVLAEMLTPAGANHRNCYHFISYVTGCSTSTIGRVYAMMLESYGNREPPEHGMKRVWQETYKQNKLAASDREKSLNSQEEVGNKEPKVSESRTSQKTSKPTNQSNTVTLIQTTADTNGQVQMQYEFQKQQLARIQRDLLEKQQQLEQQQANLQMQLMAQQALVQQPDSSQMNQVMMQQVLQQISQQQCQTVQTVLPDQIKPGTNQQEIQGNQSAQTVLSLNYVNGEIQLSISSLNQSTDQNASTTPIAFNVGNSSEKIVQNSNHVRLEGDIRKPTHVVVDEHNEMNDYRNQPDSQVVELPRLARQTQFPEGSAVSNTQSFVNRNNVNFDLTPLSNLSLPHSGPSEMHGTLNQESVISNELHGRVQIMASDQSKQNTQVFIDAMNMSNLPEQGTIAPEQTGSNTPRYLIQLAPGAGEITSHQTSQPGANPNLQGQLRLNGLPLQLMDSSGQQYHVITGGVQNQNEGVMESQDQVSSQVPVVNLAIPLSSLSNHQGDSNPGGHVQEALYNVVGTGVNEIKTLSEPNVLSGNQFNIQHGSNIQISMNAGNQNQIINTHTQTGYGNQQHKIQTGGNNETGPHQFYPQNGILPLPMYLVTNCHAEDATNEGSTLIQDKYTKHAQDKSQHNKRIVKFKNVEESSSTHESQSIVRDPVSFGQEERVVDPDLVLPGPTSHSQTHPSSGNTLRSRHSSGNPSKSRHSSENSVSIVDSFRHLTSSFKLKDLVKTGSTLTGLKSLKSNGDRSRQPSGDRSRQPSGDRSRQPSGSRSQQPSGDRSRQSSGDRFRQPSGDRSRQPSGERSRQPSGDRSRQPSGDRVWQPSGDRSRQPSGDRSRQPSGNSIFSEYSNLNTISPNLFLNKDKNLFFLQSIDSMSGAFDDIQSPDFAMFNSSPTNVASSSLTEIPLSEAGRNDFDSNFISSSLLSHENGHCERGGIKDHSHFDAVVSLNQAPPGVAMVTAEPCSQTALRNPILNSILSRPPKHL